MLSLSVSVGNNAFPAIRTRTATGFVGMLNVSDRWVRRPQFHPPGCADNGLLFLISGGPCLADAVAGRPDFEQDFVRITHAQGASDYVSLGRDQKSHALHRMFLNGSKTVVFPVFRGIFPYERTPQHRALRELPTKCPRCEKCGPDLF